MPAEVTPLNPDSDKGREVTERLSNTLARFRVAIAERKAAERARPEEDVAA